MTWGEQLAAARRARGFTQEELAERLGVSRQAVAKWERNAARPGPANARALRDLLGEDFPAPPAPSPASPTPEPASPTADILPPPPPRRPNPNFRAAGWPQRADSACFSACSRFSTTCWRPALVYGCWA